MNGRTSFPGTLCCESLKKKSDRATCSRFRLMWTFVEPRSSDSSAPEDLLAKLHDFPHVPSEISLHVEMFPSDFYRPEDRVSSRDSSSFASIVIDTAPETVLEELPLEEEAVTADACLHVSRVLRGCVLRSLVFRHFGFDNVRLISNCSHPGLVMEHYDPTTSVHTFKIAYPRRSPDEYHQFSSPATPSLSNSSR